MATKLDLILFGATGFTGQLCMQHLIENYCNDKHSFKFGLAARNIDKLKCILNGFTEIDEKEKDAYFELIECDSQNEDQIKSMISKTATIITTVGPYSVFGEKLIELCSKNGCDYIDLTGEYHWVKNMMDKYEKDATNSKARIVCIAGILASLSDCAVYSAINKLNSDEKAAEKSDENYQIKAILEPPFGKMSESGGSAWSIVNMYKQAAFKTYYDDKYPYYLCGGADNAYQNNQPRQKSILPQWNNDIKKYEAIPLFVGEIERMVFCRSNHLLSYVYGRKPIIYEGMVVFSSKYYIIALILGILGLIVPFLLVNLSFLQPLIGRIMEFFAPAAGDGPTMDVMLSARWKQYIFVESVNNKNKKMRVNIKIYGDYMYYNTSKLLVEQGLIFAIERKENKLNDKTKYGFITPAVAFGDVLIQRLNDLKKNFEISFEPKQS